MAHEKDHLLLLPLGPDKIHGFPLHGARRLPQIKTEKSRNHIIQHYMNFAIFLCKKNIAKGLLSLESTVDLKFWE